MSKALGKDINEFYNQHWPEGAYLENYTENYDDWSEQYDDGEGNLCLPENKKFELAEFGDVFDYKDECIGTFQSLFKRWQKQQSYASIVLEVPRERYDEVVAQLKELGLKVVR